LGVGSAVRRRENEGERGGGDELKGGGGKKEPTHTTNDVTLKQVGVKKQGEKDNVINWW